MFPLFRKEDESHSNKESSQVEPLPPEEDQKEVGVPSDGISSGAVSEIESVDPDAGNPQAENAGNALQAEQPSSTETPVAEDPQAAIDPGPLLSPANENDGGDSWDDDPDREPESHIDDLADPSRGAGDALWGGAPKLVGPRRQRKGRRLAVPEEAGRRQDFTPEQRLLLLDTWTRSGLPAKDFAALVGMSQSTLHKWKQRFQQHGPEGLMDQPRGTRRGSRLPELTQRAILLIKKNHPEWGCERISDMLLRGPALPASPSAVARVLHQAGYQLVEEPTRRHPDKTRRFERATPNSLWQTDLFTFVLKRQNRRLYLVAFLDDHSRFIVCYGLHASQSTALVLEVLEAGIASYGPPEEILTDNGPQYVTWRGKSRFTKRLEQRGIRQIVARPKRPQTLGKIERFWGTLWRECLETAVFFDLGDARRRIGLFIDYYNFQRGHRGVGGLVPADRFFNAAPEVLQTLKQRVAANSLELARHGMPKKPFYLTGQVEGEAFSVHQEGARLILMRNGGQREAIELAGPDRSKDAPRATDTEAAKTRDAGLPRDTLPSPVCPDGSPAPVAGDPANVPPPAPGDCPLDESLAADQEDSEDPAADDESPSAGGDAS